jgi:hypothetical protein
MYNTCIHLRASPVQSSHHDKVKPKQLKPCSLDTRPKFTAQKRNENATGHATAQARHGKACKVKTKECHSKTQRKRDGK